MTQTAISLSNQLADAVERAAPAVVRVVGRRRGPSTGIAFRPDGLIVTADHVLEWDEGIEVTLADGATLPARLLGRDPSTDLALLRVEAAGLAVPAWLDAAPRVGELVLAVGRAGQGARAAHGIVTATGGGWRTPGGGLIDRYVETDVSLFTGYSGSLLVDVSGAALGLNNAGVLRGAGVALPPATLARVAETLAAHGHVRRGFLGVGTMPVRLPPDQTAAPGQDAGLMVTSVQPGSPAARAGVMLGDVLVAFDGSALSRPRDLLGRLDDASVGRGVTLRVLRAGQPVDLELVVGSRDRSAS
jgi:S1-C subfamily serine protease